MAKKYDLFLRNYVGGWDFDADYVVYFLNRNKDRQVSVLIDSRGGSLATGLSISSAFRDHGNVEVHFTSLCASAATIASLGAAKISMASDAFYLVHKASVPICEWSSMNADQLEQRCRQLEKQAAELAKFDVAISKAYAKRCKKNPDDMLALMAKETWLSAEEALEWGFIDEITDYDDDPKTEINAQIIQDFASLGISLPKQLSRESKNSFFDKFINLFNSSMEKETKKTKVQEPENQAPKQKAPENATKEQEPQVDVLKTILGRLDKIEQRLDNPENSDDRNSKTEDKQENLPENKGAENPEDLQVVNTGGGKKEDSFASSFKSASELFNSLP